jgi:anaerobic selenocysteine-containing dehydrogenase
VAGSPHLPLFVELGPERHIPNLQGGVTGRETAPNRRGAELAGFAPAPRQMAAAEAAPPAAGDSGNGGGDGNGQRARRDHEITAEDLLHGDAAERCAVLVVCDGDLGAAAHDPAAVARLRRARTLIVFGWADSPLARAADVALPIATHAEKDGTFVNVEWRVQRFERAFPPPGQARPGVEALSELLARYDARWANLTAPQVFERLAAELPAFAGLGWRGLPATGAPLAVEQARAFPQAHLSAPEDTAVGI